MIAFGDSIEKKIEDKGWKQKIDNFFMKKLRFEKFAQNGTNTDPK
jgi:hypothetical protein